MTSGSLRHVVIAESGRLVGRTGFVSEADLQSLVVRSPQLLGPLGSDLTFLPIGWEVPVGSGRLDALLLDSQGVLTLVETKLEANDESRRKVVGQLLEYASFAAEWNVDDVRRFADEFLSSSRAPNDLRGCSLEEAIALRCGWDGDEEGDRQVKIDGLLAQIEVCLRNAAFRVVCGVDEQIDSLERIVTFLSAHSDLQVVLLQVNRFEVEAGTTVLIPSLHGDTDQMAARRPSRVATRLSVQQILDSFPEETQEALRALVQEAEAAGAVLAPGPSGFSIRGRCPIKPEPVTVAWVFAPGKHTWMKTRDISLGHGLDVPQTPQPLRELLDTYYEDLVTAGIPGDASSKGVRARWIAPDELPIKVDWIRGRLRQVIHDLQALQPA